MQIFYMKEDCIKMFAISARVPKGDPLPSSSLCSKWQSQTQVCFRGFRALFDWGCKIFKFIKKVS